MGAQTTGHEATREAQGALGRLLSWWQETRERWQRLAELRSLDPADLERLARESGMNVEDFRAIAAMPQGLPTLLAKRLDLLGLSPSEIETVSPLLVADLARTCGQCASKSQCAHDFAAADAGEAWRTYCPNAGTLDSLKQ